MLVGAVGFVAALGIAGTAGAQEPAPPAPDSPISAEVVARVTQAVGEVELRMWGGTGWLAAPGVVITNFHVSRAGNGMLRFTPSGGEPVRCWVAAADREADLAALRCPDIDRTPLPIAERPALTGEPVVVVGYPGGQGPTVSSGVITELAREIRRTDSLGFDAAIAPGSSGSPVVSADGTVLAVATFLDGGDGYGSKSPKLNGLIEQASRASPSWGAAVARLFVVRSLVCAVFVGGLAGLSGWRAGTGRGRARLVGGAVLGALAATAFTVIQIMLDGPTNMIT